MHNTHDTKATLLVVALTIAAALGSGVVAGFFFAFSVCVMRALGHRPPDQGIAAMQSINVEVLNLWFFTAFFGTATVCIILAVFSLSTGANSARYICSPEGGGKQAIDARTKRGIRFERQDEGDLKTATR